jgi:hypothetical protein
MRRCQDATLTAADGRPSRACSRALSGPVQRDGGEQAGAGRNAVAKRQWPQASLAAGVVGARVCESAMARVTWIKASATWIRPAPAEGLKKLICTSVG